MRLDMTHYKRRIPEECSPALWKEICGIGGAVLLFVLLFWVGAVLFR
jgi:hypothetical protein